MWMVLFTCQALSRKVSGCISQAALVLWNREDLKVDDEVQIMPCNNSHVFHPPCLAPWLKMHNSCPVCRHELATDDMQYERKKERDQQEAEERKGAANAVSHTDFLYT